MAELKSLTITEKVEATGKYKLKCSDGRYYTYFFPEPDKKKPGEDAWVAMIKPGATMNFDIVEKPNPKGKFPYRNVYMPREPTQQGYITAVTQTQAHQPPASPQLPYEPPQPATKLNDTDKKIRWMNSLTNATNLLMKQETKGLTKGTIFALMLEYANAYYTAEPGEEPIAPYEPGSTEKTTTAQIAALHKIGKDNYDLGHEGVRVVCGALVQRTLESLKELTEREASSCINTMQNDPESVSHLVDAKLTGETKEADKKDGKLPF